MARFTIRGKLKEIKEVYRAASEKVAALYAESEKADRMVAETSGSKMLTAEGKRKALDQLVGRRNELRKQIESVRSQAAKDATEIKNSMDRLFYDRFHPAASDLDMQTVELIRSGVLTGTELLRMAETSNITMKRVIGKALKEMKDFEREGAALIRQADNPHLRAADELMKVGDYACGGAPLSGARGARSFLKRFDELTDPIIESAPRVAVVSDYRRPGVFEFEADND